MQDTGGFTLVELMIVVAVIGILAAIAVPKYSETIRRSQEARTLGNLAMFRKTLALYQADTELNPPTTNPTSFLVPKYISSIPLKYTPPYHPEGNDVSYGNAAAMSDSGGDWFYFSDPSDPRYGEVVVNCIHTTLNGREWDKQ